MIFILRQDSLQHGPGGAGAAGNQNLLVERGRNGADVRLLLHARQQLGPVADAIGLHAHEVHVSGGAQQALLQILAESVVDGQRDDERSHAGGHANHRNRGNHADDGLAALGPQVAAGNEKLELHFTSTFAAPTLLKRS